MKSSFEKDKALAF